MNKTLTAIAFTIMTLTSSGVNASQSVDVLLKGMIVPAACELEIPVPEIKLGNIFAPDLNESTYTQLPPQQQPFTITCGTPQLIALRAIDQRADSQLNVATPTTASFGMGKDSQGNKIGSYFIYITDLDPSMRQLVDKDATGAWTQVIGNNYLYPGTGGLTSFNPVDNADEPRPIQNLSGRLNVAATINHRRRLDVSEIVTIDGLATIELVYL